jgi:hypothetical protein
LDIGVVPGKIFDNTAVVRLENKGGSVYRIVKGSPEDQLALFNRFVCDTEMILSIRHSPVDIIIDDII